MTPVANEKDGRSQERYVEYLSAVIAGGNMGFIFSLLGSLNWQECVLLMASLGALAGGAVFTFFEMRALN